MNPSSRWRLSTKFVERNFSESKEQFGFKAASTRAVSRKQRGATGVFLIFENHSFAPWEAGIWKRKNRSSKKEKKKRKEKKKKKKKAEAERFFHKVRYQSPRVCF
ncbi:hypothetical protein JOB18_035256 [Solea senegalensis]|uniref:Uncharacterized protein n=1 Tax=Solea senegalensis TaxID=28829 RepID=A0AAV6SAR1_SOLSE|nr:hypothetical protein JOB18_035256 [Solea senegalensis]